MRSAGSIGPRPLALHLRSAVLGAAGGADADARERVDELLRGLRAYWRHPRPARAECGREVWREGSCRLLDWAPGGSGTPVLVVPSLVNRARILDLVEGRSLLGSLSASGARPLLLDWGEPGREELGLDLAGYAHGRAGAALRAALRLAGGRPPVVLGHCMGGLLALALAATAPPGAIAGVALLATPWDFHAGMEHALPLLATGLAPLSLAIGTAGAAPVELLQAWFALLDPGGVAAKFRAFAAMTPGDPRAGLFVAVEDWLGDGVPLAGPVAVEVLWHWYAANLPARGLWEPGGRRVLPERLGVPFFLAIPRADRIVPPASAEALAARLPGAEVVRPGGGHVAMIVGGRALDELHRPLAAWLRRIASETDRGARR